MHIPKIGYEHKNLKKKRVVKVVAVMLIAFTTMFSMLQAINPIFNMLCLEKAKGIGVETLNSESNKLLKNTKYDDFVTITKDNGNNIRMIQVDTVTANKLATNLAYNIQTELCNTDGKTVSMPFRKHFWE